MLKRTLLTVALALMLAPVAARAQTLGASPGVYNPSAAAGGAATITSGSTSVVGGTNGVICEVTAGKLDCTTLTPTDDSVLVGNGTNWQIKALTTCTGAGKAVTYDASTNTFGCNTIASGITSGTTAITGGADKSVLFDDGGVVNAADPNIKYDKTTATLSLTSPANQFNDTTITGGSGQGAQLTITSAAGGSAGLYIHSPLNTNDPYINLQNANTSWQIQFDGNGTDLAIERAFTDSFSFTTTGATEWFGLATASAPALSAANNGNMYYDSTLHKWQCSSNNGAFGNCTATVGFGGAGTVTSVAATVPGGFSIAGSPVTTSGTLAISASGTSGGILGYTGSTTMASSVALNANVLVKGGGAGATPLNSSITDNGTTVSTSEPFSSAGLTNSGARNLTSIVTPNTSGNVAATTGYEKVTAGAGGVTRTLPSATGSGRLIDFRKDDSAAGSVTIARAGSDTINGATSVVLANQYEEVTLQDSASGAWDMPIETAGTATNAYAYVCGNTTGLALAATEIVASWQPTRTLTLTKFSGIVQVAGTCTACGVTDHTFRVTDGTTNSDANNGSAITCTSAAGTTFAGTPTNTTRASGQVLKLETVASGGTCTTEPQLYVCAEFAVN